MIIVTMPVLADPKEQEEIRKALLNLAAQANQELDEIRARIAVLEAAP